MSFAENPSRKSKAATAEGFIAKGPRGAKRARNITMRFNEDILERTSQAAERLGISRNAFFSMVAVAKLEEMGI